MSGRGLYFCNCTRGSDTKSLLAVYNVFIENGGNNGTQPDLQADVTSSGFTVWETGVSRPVNFGGETAIDFTIETNAQSITDESSVGFAVFERNFGEHWEVFRDNGHYLFTTDDGFDCTSSYFSREVTGPAPGQ